MINDILTAIITRLATKETAIKYIDEDWGQLDYYSPNPPIKFPGVLVDIDNISWKNQGKLVQDGPMNINIRVADLKLTNTSLRAPAAQKTAAVSIWRIIDNIHKALHGWSPGQQYGLLTRISTGRVKRDDGIREYRIVYQCTVTDASAMPVENTTPKPVVQIAEIKKATQ